MWSFLTVRATALISFLVFTIFLLPVHGKTNTYCINIARSENLSKIEKIAGKIDCRIAPYLRIEKSGSQYILKAGIFTSVKSAQFYLKSIKALINSSMLAKCPESTPIKVFCPNVVKITLKDLGYPNDVILTGNRFQHTFFIPVLPEFYKGTLTLKMKLSPAAPPKGRLTVKINDIPYQTYSIEKIGNAPTIKIPITPDRYSSFSKITVSFNFLPEEDICKSLNNSDIYAIIYNSSELTIQTRKLNHPTIYQYLLSYEGSFNIKTESLLEAARTAYFLSSLYKKMSLYNLNFSGTKEIVITSLEDTTRVEKGRLFLNPKDTKAFTTSFLLKSDILYLKKLARLNKMETGSFIPLKAFGFRTTTLQGIGEISYKFSIPFQQFRGKPTRLLMLLRFSVQEINPENGDRLWCNLFVNNQLVWSKEIPPYGNVNSIQEYMVEIPDYTLTFGTNNFKVTFSYYPGGKTCMGPVPTIKTTLFDTSAILIPRISTRYENVKDLLSSLGGKVGVVIDSSLPERFVEDTFKLLGYFNPEIDELVGAGKLTDNSTDFFIVVTPFENLKAPQNTPVVFDRQIEIVNPLTHQKVLEVDGNYRFILLQSGHFRGKPALFISPSHIDSCDIISRLNWNDLNRLIGNANFLFENELYPLEIGKKFRVKYSTETRLEFYLKKYKIVLFIFAFFVVTLFIVYIWRRLT